MSESNRKSPARKNAAAASTGNPKDAPVVELGVRGPRGEAGFLVQADFPEGLVWDLEHEIVSSRRSWLSAEEGWWIASSYFDTALDIILRFFPSVRVRYPDTGEERLLRAG